MGRKRVAAECLQHLCTMPEIQIVGVLTDSHLETSVTRDVAKAHGLPVLDHSTAYDQMACGSLSYDLGLSVLYWRKLKGPFLSVPKLRNINFHPAPLPEYKGTAGYNLAILEGLDNWGVTAHYIDESIDTGGIIEVSTFPIDAQLETVGTIEHRCAAKIFDLFCKLVRQVLNQSTILPTLPNIGGRYVSRRQMEEMKQIRAGDDVARKVRAFWYPPYDGAWIEIGGEKYTLVNRDILLRLGDPAASTLFTKSSNNCTS